MADSSVSIDPGTTTAISTRTNAAAEHMQVVVLGIDGSNDVIGPGQATMAGSLPVVVASDNNVITKDAGISQTTTLTFTTDADWSSASDVTAAPTAGQKIVVTDLIVSVNTECYVSLLEETSGTELMRLYMSASVPAQITPRGKFKLPTADRKLRMQSSAAAAGAVSCIYYSEA